MCALAAGLVTIGAAAGVGGPTNISPTPSPAARAAVQQQREGATRTAAKTSPPGGRYEGDSVAIAEGAKLFIGYNCIDCHGADGSGAMGPSLADNRWRFGGSPNEVFRSIVDGRPEGMPTWGPRMPVDHAWKLVAYVRSLGAGKDVTTENFTSEGVERSGR